ncbi:hypothetical protein TKK_0012263 [Trichogramma kaykai]
MNHDTFKYIYFKTKSRLQKRWCNLHSKPILAEESLVLTIRFLATGINFTQLSLTFRMGISTVRKVIIETMDVI